MSFPVLQRMDRKRPEMIQPISWKAEALKGLARGLQVGMQMANTVNAIQLRRAENARAEQAHALNTQLAQEQVKQAKLLNQEREIDSQLKSLYLQGETNYQLQQQGISANGLLFDYTSGMTRVQQWMKDTGQDAQPVPSGINEALRSGYIQKLVLDAPSVMNSIADPGASVADKFVAYSDFKDKANPFFGPLKSAAMRLDPKHPVFTAASTLLPFENQTMLWDNTTMTILANVNRSEDENRAIFVGLPVKDQDGKDILPQQAMAEQRPVQVKINSVIGGLRRGHFIEDMANEIAGASNPEPFMNYLKGTVPKTHYDKLAARVDALRGKVDVKPVATTDTTTVRRDVPVLDQAFDKTVETITLPGGEKIQRVADPGIIESVINESRASSNASEIMAGIDSKIKTQEFPPLIAGYMPGSNQNFKNVDRKKFQAEQWAVYSEAQPAIEAQLVTAIKEAGTNPTKENKQRVKALQSVNVRLIEKKAELEKKYGFKKLPGDTVPLTAPASAPATVPASAPATAGAGTSRPVRGDVVEGYRFKGGDPSKPENWEKVQ